MTFFVNQTYGGVTRQAITQLILDLEHPNDHFWIDNWISTKKRSIYIHYHQYFLSSYWELFKIWLCFLNQTYGGVKRKAITNLILDLEHQIDHFWIDNWISLKKISICIHYHQYFWSLFWELSKIWPF